VACLFGSTGTSDATISVRKASEVMVLYAWVESFTLMTPAGHPEAG
jgi:hypothetical protein